MKLKQLLLGTLFGLILTKSEVISWFSIHKMFYFEEAHMYLIIASAIVTGAVSVRLLKLLGIKRGDGKEMEVPEKKFNRGFIYGGILFGIGWFLTGSCPGPIFTQIGAGEWPALFTLLGALAGAMTYSYLKPRLPH